MTAVLTALPSSRKKSEEKLVLEERRLCTRVLHRTELLVLPDSATEGQSGMMISAGLWPRLWRRVRAELRCAALYM
ncbi:hypothetical protein E2C01_050067 [Portunus trituberculatus]|uniref:Uncharacterized protein n=1 Tax=Portunus trituberculatus TaxID=210409 RepID=A0A5B7GHX0_PORTR|nr:hypothetical protein [Portunus trituberculatus]